MYNIHSLNIPDQSDFLSRLSISTTVCKLYVTPETEPGGPGLQTCRSMEADMATLSAGGMLHKFREQRLSNGGCKLEGKIVAATWHNIGQVEVPHLCWCVGVDHY